jgi:hypothetical protein
METKMGNPTFLDCIDILLSYSFKIKGYMPNLGIHLGIVDFFFQQLKYYILLLLFNMQKDHN